VRALGSVEVDVEVNRLGVKTARQGPDRLSRSGLGNYCRTITNVV
jgi:hypothetical protein